MNKKELENLEGRLRKQRLSEEEIKKALAAAQNIPEPEPEETEVSEGVTEMNNLPPMMQSQETTEPVNDENPQENPENTEPLTEGADNGETETKENDSDSPARKDGKTVAGGGRCSDSGQS